jgi:hypothetical protein
MFWVFAEKNLNERGESHATRFQSQAETAVRAHQGQRQEARESDKRAKEIASRTGNKERARSGESKTKSRTSTADMSSSRRGGMRSHTGAGGQTKEQLYSEAKRRNIKGRSSMSKAQLEKALS